MGGSLGRGNMTSAAEFNVFTDPHAAQIMYSSQIPLVMVGLDVTLAGRISDETTAKLKQFGRAGQMLHDIIGHDFDHDEKERRSTISKRSFISNIQKLLKLKTTGSISSQKAPAVGETVADIRGAYHNGKTNAKVCVGIDTVAFNQWLLDKVSQNMQN